MSGAGWWQALVNLLYPKRLECLLCTQPFLRGEEVVCSLCLAQVQAARPPFCRVCGREVSQTGVCQDCRRREECFFLRAVSYGPYEGQLRELLLQLKKERRLELVPWLGERMFDVFAATLFSSGIECLVPVPMSLDKQRVRGFNQAEELARALASHIELPVVQALGWQGASRGQAAKNRRERLAGMDERVLLGAAATEVAGRTVCLIDDVYTTGETANACAKRLHEAGARTVYVLTVAR